MPTRQSSIWPTHSMVTPTWNENGPPLVGLTLYVTNGHNCRKPDACSVGQKTTSRLTSTYIALFTTGATCRRQKPLTGTAWHFCICTFTDYRFPSPTDTQAFIKGGLAGPRARPKSPLPRFARLCGVAEAHHNEKARWQLASELFVSKVSTTTQPQLRPHRPG